MPALRPEQIIRLLRSETCSKRRKVRMSFWGWQIDVYVCGDPCTRVPIVGVHLADICNRFEKCFADYSSLTIRSDQPCSLKFLHRSIFRFVVHFNSCIVLNDLLDLTASAHFTELASGNGVTHGLLCTQVIRMRQPVGEVDAYQELAALVILLSAHFVAWYPGPES